VTEAKPARTMEKAFMIEMSYLIFYVYTLLMLC
jgi:hypothetical protein